MLGGLKAPTSISVAMPVYNGAESLDRAIRTVMAQTFPDWELIAVDDGSSDDSHELLRAWAEREPRIRVIRCAENGGASAARNLAIQTARGQFVTYLDRDDEYYPDYLARVAQLGEKVDVLIFAYDFVYEDGGARGRPPGWDPGNLRQLLFAQHLAVPLGVAHTRELWQRVGGFNELLWHDEDTDLWRRMARAGARFVFLPQKSGRYHVRGDSASRVPHITWRQRQMFLENWRAGRKLYYNGNGEPEIADLKLEESPHPNPLPEGEGTKKKIAFVSPHCVIDFTNGAATATLDGLELLAGLGFKCQAFCSSRLDSCEEVLVEEVLAQRGLRYAVRNAQIGPYRGRMIFTSYGKVPVTLFNSASTRGAWINAEEVRAFLTACEIFLTKNRPDVVWTYGGDTVSLAIQQLVKRLDIPLLFGLHNFAYIDPRSFGMVDYVIVPTEFCRQYYWEAVGLASLNLPLVVDPARVAVIQKAQGPQGNLCAEKQGTQSPKAEIRSPKSETNPEIKDLKSDTYCHHTNPLPAGEGTMFVTFVNPVPRKGVNFFARSAEVLSGRRPDIPLLLVEGAGKATFLPQLGVDLSGLKNVRIMPNSPDARQFLAITKILLMPSLMENAGLVAMEAMFNGIPVVASNRGGLPETIGNAGFLIDIPARYTPETRDVPSAEEVEPWVETVIRLWDDAAEYERRSRAAREHAQQWHPDRLAPVYREFFSQITHQPGPPLVPQWIAWQPGPPLTDPSAVVVSNREQLLLKFPRDAVVAEIGVNEGAFTRSILRTGPRRLHLIDPWQKQSDEYVNDPTNDGDFERKYRTVCETLGRLPNVEIIRDYSLRAAEQFPDGYFDWIYLDADHSYAAVARDLEAWVRKIRPGGIFAGHDYCNYKWIQVRTALDDFLNKRGRKLDFLTSDDAYLSWGFVV